MVNMSELKLTMLQQAILRLVFIKAGTAINQRAVARLLGVSAPAVMKALPRLERHDFINITRDKESKRLAIELNRDNHRVMQLKRVDNLKQIYESGLSDFLEKEFAGGTLVVFGSYSRGDDTERSDLDLAIIGRKEKAINLSNYEKALERKINFNFYESWKTIHKNLKENLCNGMVLAGGVEL